MKIEADSGYIVKIGEPVCVADIKATSTSVAVPSDPIADGDYLISLEVNGTVVAHRDTFSFASGSATVGDYTVAYASNTVTVSTTSNNDIVRLMIEPLKVKTTDEFRAAVGTVAPKSGGGLGGGVLVVTDTDGTLDKTWQEIHDAMLSGGAVISTSSTDSIVVSRTRYNAKDSAYEVTILGGIMYFASTASDYPTLSE